MANKNGNSTALYEAEVGKHNDIYVKLAILGASICASMYTIDGNITPLILAAHSMTNDKINSQSYICGTYDVLHKRLVNTIPSLEQIRVMRHKGGNRLHPSTQQASPSTHFCRRL